jgi:hypothetical protein
MRDKVGVFPFNTPVNLRRGIHLRNIYKLKTLKMVTIVGLEKKVNLKTNESYNVLVIQGSAEVLRSKTTNRPYISARRATLPCTLDDIQAKALIGQSLPGAIEKLECKEFEIKLPNGKKLKISHTYQYSPDPVTMEEVVG